MRLRIGKMMDDEKLLIILNRIGKRCFVRFFELFACDMPREQMIEKLQQTQNKQYSDGKPLWEPWRELTRGKKWDEAGCNRRVANALQIFKARRQKCALEMVRDSNLPIDDKIHAKELLKNPK